MYSECEQTLGEASATNNVCAGGYIAYAFFLKLFPPILPYLRL
jgi:hypothetical protein